MLSRKGGSDGSERCLAFALSTLLCQDIVAVVDLSGSRWLIVGEYLSRDMEQGDSETGTKE